MIFKNQVFSWPDLDKSELNNKVEEGAHIFILSLSKPISFPWAGSHLIWIDSNWN